jgi:hypothetical protein
MEVSAREYDYRDVKPVLPKGTKRSPHPVVMMLKRVIALAIDLLELPPNPLDDLVHRCGGRTVVAEMTGRHTLMEMQPSGSFARVKRAGKGVSQEALNITERQRFMNDEKLIAIISDAASTGISLQVRSLSLACRKIECWCI